MGRVGHIQHDHSTYREELLLTIEEQLLGALILTEVFSTMFPIFRGLADYGATSVCGLTYSRMAGEPSYSNPVCKKHLEIENQRYR